MRPHIPGESRNRMPAGRPRTIPSRVPDIPRYPTPGDRPLTFPGELTRKTQHRSVSDLNTWGLVTSCACCSPMLPTRFSPFSPAAALEKCSFGPDAWASRLRSSRPAPAKLRFFRLASGTEGETRSLRHRKSPDKPQTRHTPRPRMPSRGTEPSQTAPPSGNRPSALRLPRAAPPLRKRAFEDPGLTAPRTSAMPHHPRISHRPRIPWTPRNSLGEFRVTLKKG